MCLLVLLEPHFSAALWIAVLAAWCAAALLAISVDAEGRIFLQDTELELDALAPRLMANPPRIGQLSQATPDHDMNLVVVDSGFRFC